MAEEKPWNLWYWPGIKGRGEYVRLVFEEAGVPYREPAREAGSEGFKVIVDWWLKGGNTGFPVRAPPAIERGTICPSGCSNHACPACTPVVASYLGQRYGLHGDTLEDKAHVDEILAVVADAVAEGRLAFHPKDFYSSHKGQEAESVPFREQYGTQRLPKHVQYFEAILSRATPGAEGERYLVGNKITVADLHVFQFLSASEQHYREAYDKLEAPLCKAHKLQIGTRTRIAAYLASDRVQPWDKDSMM